MFGVIVTVYVPTAAPAATMKPPSRMPLEIKHVGEPMRPDGDDEMLHVLPT
jgi:hypothetical protein